MYNQIMVAFDGSQGSKKALTHAIQLSKTNDAKLTIVHVEKESGRDPSMSMSSGIDMSVNYGGADVKAYEGKIEKDAAPSDLKSKHSDHDMFSEAKKEVAQARIDAAYEVLRGDPVKRLCNYADSSSTDVLVIGSRGVSGIKKFMLGSISEKVAKEAGIPVLIVK